MGPDMRRGGTLIPGAVTLVMLAVVVLVPGTHGRQQKCFKFSDLPSGRTSLQCGATCMTPRNTYNHGVFGTTYYTPDSEVCVAAIHAGVLGLKGGRVFFTKINNHGNISRGTLRNRVKSMSKNSLVKFKFEATQEAIKAEDLASDVIVVHNSYSDDTLYYSCLADRKNRILQKSDIRNWMYEVVSPSIVNIIKEIYAENRRCIFPMEHDGKTYYGCAPGSIFLLGWPWCYTDYDEDFHRCSDTTGKAVIATVTGSMEENRRVLRCLGVTPATDVLAVIKKPGQKYTSSASSIRTTVGSNLTVPIARSHPGIPKKTFLRKQPDPWLYTDNSEPDTDLPLTFIPVSMEDDGIYILGNDLQNFHFKEAKWKTERNGDYFHLSVQKCKVGSFGHACQLVCERKFLGFDVPSYKCKGLTFCVSEPYGCSCAPGFTGPLCNEECPPGQYGAGCYLRCSYCVDQRCNPYNGQCHKNCVAGVSCYDNKPRDLPRLRVPPTISDVLGYSAVLTFSDWDRKFDDGSPFYPVIGYVVELRREGDTKWKEVWYENIGHTSTNNTVSLTNLQSNQKYLVRVLVKTLRGAANGTTNKRVHIATFTTPYRSTEIGELMTQVIVGVLVLMTVIIVCLSCWCWWTKRNQQVTPRPTENRQEPVPSASVDSLQDIDDVYMEPNVLTRPVPVTFPKPSMTGDVLNPSTMEPQDYEEEQVYDQIADYLVDVQVEGDTAYYHNWSYYDTAQCGDE